MPQFPFNFDARRVKTYLFRLPLCTRLLILITVAFYLAGLVLTWVPQWGALIPDQVGLATRVLLAFPRTDKPSPDTCTVYRLNTFPFVHLGIIHVLLNVLALTPLLERFESEFGSLVTLLLFTGPFGLLPGAIYILIERFILRGNTAVQGGSIWVFLLLGNEAIKTHKQNPYLTIGPVTIPTWTTPMIANFFIAILVPNTSFIGHTGGLLIGYLWGLGYIRFLAPSEKILKWIEGKLNLLGRLPHYVSVDQKKYGRYGVLPTTSSPRTAPTLTPVDAVPLGYVGQRLGP